MRKRSQARASVNADDMWITVPPSGARADEEKAEPAARTDQKTYEDTWYQVLRRRPPEAAAAPPPEPEEPAATEE